MIRAFEERFPGVVVLEGYGVPETASTTTFDASAKERKVRSIGRPICGAEVRVVDDEGEDLSRVRSTSASSSAGTTR
ncbi:AMP-binding protein [Blastococcus capsensis]|uniref:AMP-binding protein n=1 Tax=Blastococcus capsensis TaxID=1564163 RepID=UPI003D6B08F1